MLPNCKPSPLMHRLSSLKDSEENDPPATPAVRAHTKVRGWLLVSGVIGTPTASGGCVLPQFRCVSIPCLALCSAAFHCVWRQRCFQECLQAMFRFGCYRQSFRLLWVRLFFIRTQKQSELQSSGHIAFAGSGKAVPVAPFTLCLPRPPLHKAFRQASVTLSRVTSFHFATRHYRHSISPTLHCYTTPHAFRYISARDNTT